MCQTNQEKSKVICERVGIEPKKLPSYGVNVEGAYSVTGTIKKYPDLFTPEGQAILAQALLEKDNLFLVGSFNWWRAVRNKPTDLHLIAETKLAELFYEFLQTEKEK